MLFIFNRQYSFFAVILIFTALTLLHFLLPNNIDYHIFWQNSFFSSDFSMSPFLAKIISFILIAFQSVLIFHITNSIRQIDQYSFIFTWLFVFLIHTFPEFYTLSPALVANTLLLFSIFLFYKNQEGYANTYIFYIGFILGISFLIWTPSIFFLPFFIIFFFHYNKLSLKVFNILLFSIAVPILNFYFISYLWLQNLPPIHLKFALNILSNKSIVNYLPSVFLLIFILIGLFNTTVLAKKINQSGRLFFNSILSASIIFLVLIFFNTGSFINSFIILCFPASVYLGLAINIIKRPIVSELIHLTIILLATFNCIIYAIDF
ncbi:MAG: hypothetical protein R2836_08375 [Chitinophagales bacterium]